MFIPNTVSVVPHCRQQLRLTVYKTFLYTFTFRRSRAQVGIDSHVFISIFRFDRFSISHTLNIYSNVTHICIEVRAYVFICAMKFRELAVLFHYNNVANYHTQIGLHLFRFNYNISNKQNLPNIFNYVVKYGALKTIR